MNVFDDDVKPKGTKSKQSGNNCDIFEPSVYTPGSSKYRADYIKRITSKITVELDASKLADEVPEGEAPSVKLEVTGKDPEKHLKFILEYLRGPRGFNGSVDNFVVLSESEYERLPVKDPNKFYFTYEGEYTPSYIEDEVLYTQESVNNKILITSSHIENHILTL